MDVVLSCVKLTKERYVADPQVELNYPCPRMRIGGRGCPSPPDMVIAYRNILGVNKNPLSWIKRTYVLRKLAKYT